MILIDRFENNIAVMEYQGKTYLIPKAWLPSSAKEGDIIIIKTAVDEEESARRRQETERKTAELFE